MVSAAFGLGFGLGLIVLPAARAHADKTIAFDKKKIDNAANDGCTFGDFNNDKRLDIACGEAWYEAPAWTKRVYRANRMDDVIRPLDVDGDGWTDLIVSQHGASLWYRNNRQLTGLWAMETVPCTGGHSGDLLDIDGDGKRRELVSSVDFAPTNWSEYVGGADGKWVCHEVSPALHNWGAGAGDINGDGRMDIIRPDAWYEAPADPRNGTWIPHEIALGALENMPTEGMQHLEFVERIHERRNSVGQHGHTVQLYAQDVDGDGLNDLIASSAHRMGVMWYKQIRDGGSNGIRFSQRVIDGSVSILHSLAQADMDRDGDLDLLTSKRWRGHGKDEDPYTEDPYYVVWYEFTKGQAPYWKRHFITYGEAISAGTQIGIGDYDQDGDSDLVVIGNGTEGKGNGPWLFTNKLGQATVEDAGPGPGNAVPWIKHRLDSLPSQASAFGDFDKDGKPDIAAGDFWYAHGTWKKTRFRTMDGTIDAQGNGSRKQDGMLASLDVDEDGWPDLVAGSRKAGLLWYRNPGVTMAGATASVGAAGEAAGAAWTASVIDIAGNYETGGLWDVDRDGRKREIVSSAELSPVLWWEFKAGEWLSHTVASDVCNLGAGVGDVNGDGRPDLIRPNALYLAPADPAATSGPGWIKKTIAIGALDDRPFGQTNWAPNLTAAGPDWLGRNEAGGHGHSSRIQTFDVNKDGRMDLIASSAHRVGVSWYEQQADGRFLQRIIDAQWSQAHASGFGDIDGDGDPDLVTGKDYKAEDEKDPMWDGELLLAWYELDPGKPYPWIKHVISSGENIGAGAELDLADYDGDGDLDVAVTGKNGGPWLFENGLRTPVSLGRAATDPPLAASAGDRGGTRRLRFEGNRLLVVERIGGMEQARDVRGNIVWTHGASDKSGAPGVPGRAKGRQP
jgi:hypothetical protein